VTTRFIKAAFPTQPTRRVAILLVVAGAVAILGLTLSPAPDQASYSALTPLLCLVCGDTGGADVFLNLLLFAPMATGLRLLGWSWLRVVATAALLSLAVEGLQYFVVTGRDASLSDLLTNTGGAAIAAAVAPALPEFVAPAPRAARRYLAGSAVLWLTVLGLSALAMMPWAPRGRLRSECTRSATIGDVFSRTVRSVVLNDMMLPCDGEVYRSAPIGEALRAGTVTVDVVMVSGDPERSRALIYTVRGRGRLLLMLAQHRRSVAFTVPTVSRHLRLFSPILRLPDAFPQAVGLPVEIHAGARDRHMWISSRHSGAGATMELALSPSQGWSVLFPWGIDPRRPFRLVTAIWIAGLILPVGYFAAGVRSPPMAAAGIALALGAGLWVLPRVAGYPPVHWSEWVGGAAGAALGWALCGIAGYLQGRCGSPSTSAYSSS
jgi:hypothetical protein